MLKDPLERPKAWPGSTPVGDEDSDDEPDSENEAGAVTQSHVSETMPQGTSRTSSPEIHYQVSSTQLKNVYRYFRNMFTGKFSETVLDPSDVKYHIAAENFHPKALEHVMNIVYVKTKGLPRKLYLERLAHIAVLVDYNDMKEAISFHTEIWADAAARKKISGQYGRDLVLRTFLARAFGDEKNLRHGSDIILQHSKGLLPDLGIPMLRIADLFDEHRCKGIQALLDRIGQLAGELEAETWGCSKACRAMLLGSFLMQTRVLRFCGVRLYDMQHQFIGLSFDDPAMSLKECTYPESWWKR